MNGDNGNNISINSILTDNNFKFCDHTTYGLGGKAKIAYFPKTEEEAIPVFLHLKSTGEKFVVLGNGSDVLASDNYYDGAVISTKRLCGIYETQNSLYCLSGTTVTQLLKYCIENDIGGYEYLAGIPATLGGLALMNGGIPEKHIGEDILRVKFFDGKISEFSAEMCKFGNKYSTMRDINAIVLGISLSKNAVKRETVKKNIEKYFAKRRTQPKGKSCGCVFKNPPNLSAGKLIDSAGLKGLRIGGAEVSSEHANFIINNGGSAKDVFDLICKIKKEIFDFCGVMLEEEVVYIGEFNETNC